MDTHRPLLENTQGILTEVDFGQCYETLPVDTRRPLWENTQGILAEVDFWQCYETLPVDELHDNKNIVYFESEFGSRPALSLCKVSPVILHGVVSRYSGRGCVKSFRSFYTRLYPCPLNPT